MHRHPFGRAGLVVSELCLGTMTFGGGAGIWSQIGAMQQVDAERLIGQALDAGVNFIDTADVYSESVNICRYGCCMSFGMTSITTETRSNGHTGALFEGLTVRGDSTGRAAFAGRSAERGGPRRQRRERERIPR